MDGDQAPLKDIVKVCKTYEAALIVDEAHAIGIKGIQGKGLVEALHLHQDVFARVHTFGKAAGYHGACIVGSKNLKQYLVNFARPFIYSTALPPQEINALRICLEFMHKADDSRNKIQENISLFNKLMNCNAPSPIIPVKIPGNEYVKHAAAQLQAQGFDVRPILSPTVPAGSERLRIIIHSYNSKLEIEKLIIALKPYLNV
jgi:8-amino-7-oxononanoate synthase